MNRLFYFATGWFSTLSLTNLFSGTDPDFWRDSLLSMLGGICSTVVAAWLRWRWERRKRRDS